MWIMILPSAGKFGHDCEILYLYVREREQRGKKRAIKSSPHPIYCQVKQLIKYKGQAEPVLRPRVRAFTN